MTNLTFNKTNKAFLIVALALVFALSVAVILQCDSNVASATEQTSETTNKIVHFINPTAMTVVGDYLFVADNVEGGHTELLCFDLSAQTPTFVGNYAIFTDITRLSADESSIFALSNGSVTQLSVGDKGTLTAGDTYAINGVVDFAFGTGVDQQQFMMALTADDLLRHYTINGNSSFDSVLAGGKWQNNGNLASLGANVYALHDDAISIYDCQKGNMSSTQISLANKQAKGILVVDDNTLGAFNNATVYTIDLTQTTPTATELFVANSANGNVKLVGVHNGNYFVLNANNKIDVYALDTSTDPHSYKIVYTIGSDVVTLEEPTAFVGYTLAQSVGYPTNIIYKTAGENSIDNILTAYTGTYIILQDDLADTRDYYYVLVGNKFGWVKKSDSVALPTQDGKLNLLPTEVSVDVTYTAKFNSMSTVYVSDLPFEGAPQRSFSQTNDNRTQVDLLQRFAETKADGSVTIWYYIRFVADNATQFGFVESSKVGNFHGTAQTENLVVEVGDRKLNSALFSYISLHPTADLDENQFVTSNGGEQIKLYAGQRVTVIRQTEKASFVQILHDDGTADYGWVANTCVMDLHGITTNTIVGLVFLCVAIALAIILACIFRKHSTDKPKKKKHII